MMNDDDEDEVVVQIADSKCSTCKYGLCVKEIEVQTFFGPSTLPGNAFEGKSDEPAVSQVSFPNEKIRSVCFFGSKETPLVFGIVTDCSKYAD